LRYEGMRVSHLAQVGDDLQSARLPMYPCAHVFTQLHESPRCAATSVLCCKLRAPR
jgi:hypothetical protein